MHAGGAERCACALVGDDKAADVYLPGFFTARAHGGVVPHVKLVLELGGLLVRTGDGKAELEAAGAESFCFAALFRIEGPHVEWHGVEEEGVLAPVLACGVHHGLEKGGGLGVVCIDGEHGCLNFVARAYACGVKKRCEDGRRVGGELAVRDELRDSARLMRFARAGGKAAREKLTQKVNRRFAPLGGRHAVRGVFLPELNVGKGGGAVGACIAEREDAGDVWADGAVHGGEDVVPEAFAVTPATNADGGCGPELGEGDVLPYGVREHGAPRPGALDE